MAGPLGGGQRLGHHRVVVHRHQVHPQAAQKRSVGAGAQGGARRADAPVQGGKPQARAFRLDRADGGLLEDPDTRVQAGPAQPPGQPGRVHHGAAVAVPHARRSKPGEAISARTAGRVQQLRGLTGRARCGGEPARGGGVVPQVGEVPGPGRDGQFPGPLEVAVDPVPGHGGLDLVQVLPPELLQHRHLRPESLQPVGQAVGEAGRAEPAVAAGCGPAGGAALQHDHVGGRVALLGQQRGPQPGESRADHGQIGGGGLAQRRGGLRGVWTVQPEAGRPGVPESGLARKGHHPRITGLNVASYSVCSFPLTSA